jgi:hypothetical protein
MRSYGGCRKCEYVLMAQERDGLAKTKRNVTYAVVNTLQYMSQSVST